MNELVKSGPLYPAAPAEERSSKRFGSAVRRFMFENRGAAALCCVLILLGAAMGAAAYVHMSRDDKNLVFTYIQNYFGGSMLIGASAAEIFKASVPSLAVTGIIIAVSGIIPLFYPFALARLTFKGFSMGFSAAFFIARYGLKGAAFALVSVMMCNAVTLTASVWLLLASRQIRLESRAVPKRKGKSKRRFKIPLIAVSPKGLAEILACLVFYLAAALLGAGFESVIGHGMMRSLYGIFSAFG